MNYDDFPLKAYDKVRFSDTDSQGHVNNANFSTFLETGRTELLYLYGRKPLHDEGAFFVIAKQELNFVAEIHWPGTVEIGTLISKIGNTSIGLYQKLFQNDKVVAEANTVIVQVDEETKKPKPLSSQTRDILAMFYRKGQ